MKIIDKYTSVDLIKDQFNIDFDKALFVDIETTGFMRNRNHIYMIGLGMIENDKYNIKLLFSENNDEEGLILQEFLDIASDYNTLISFNGLAFDFPFIKERCKLYDISFDTSSFLHIDIYKYAKKASNLLQLPNYKQKCIESFLGIERKDEKSGGQLIDIYHNYVKNKSQSDYQLLIQHNLDDVAGMIKILPVINYAEIPNNISSISIESDKSNDNEIIIKGNLSCNIPVCIDYSKDDIFIRLNENKIMGIIKIVSGQMRHYFDDYKNYRYLIDEDTIIPKVLCSTIPKDRIRSVKKDECYIQNSSNFLRIYDDIWNGNYPLFTDEYHSDKKYIEIEKLDDEDIKKYFLNALGSIL